MGVTTVNDDVSFLKNGVTWLTLTISGKLGNELINCISSFHKEDDFARFLELVSEFLDAVGSLDSGT